MKNATRPAIFMVFSDYQLPPLKVATHPQRVRHGIHTILPASSTVKRLNERLENDFLGVLTVHCWRFVWMKSSCRARD
jgi:hypothetical protein